ncbi:DUF3618 domain-containing protein [Cellulomonas hominis]|jgi:hypothetical protein|uniref:DUF3618 domain-containing protein n=1 Tax=Cellulomonas hominis TaxID=156981 RepID=A0A511F9T9_9CELL|nr:DUF3618 domain-containing protein [Cellulomonas hominis]MBB5473511.1 hypothetical protein [Cellulomonas hominis]MBU5421438.1 DUF3618 domain-containing protein [Cellulomonas hominis]NKY12521.1 DUF3618 domain-containing protein [Cellulomonas hominis]GEL46026.1 hypothetical protein CHO01_11420 [Cellulomonas hominis]
MSDTTPKPSISDLETEIALTRAELAGTADALAARLSPKRQAADVKAGAQKLVRDAVGTDPAADPANRDRARILLAAGVGAVVLAVVLIARR